MTAVEARSRPDPSDVEARLSHAAERLKRDASEDASEVGEPTAVSAEAPDQRLLAVLDGLERADVAVRRARERLAELETRLGPSMQIRRN